MGSAFCDAPVFISHISTPTFYRLWLPSLLPEIAKCIYLDTDIIVCKDLRELYETDLGDCCLAGVRGFAFYSFPDTRNKEKHAKRLCLPDMEHYVNAGMMLMDLRKMRDWKLEEQFETALKRNFACQDQDVLNVVCFGRIMNLPFRYNAMTKYPLQDPDAWEHAKGLQEAVSKKE